jgi:hypothetical protein
MGAKNIREPWSPSAINVKLRERIVLTTHSRRRWGYRMVDYVLRS